MDVSNERARTAGLTLTDSESTVRNTRAWIQGRNLPPALSPKCEAELIRITRTARRGAIAVER
jgi:2'-hydroxyisoflavone reductase